MNQRVAVGEKGMGQRVILGVVVLALVALVGCRDPGTSVSRLPELQKMVEQLAGKPEGRYTKAELPPEIRPRDLLAFYTDGHGAFAFEFASEYTVDLNPAFVFVTSYAQNPEAAAREVCRKSGLVYRNAFKEPGWYRATGQ